jgi:hypothetical protein
MKKFKVSWGIVLLIISFTSLVFSQGTYVVPGGNLSGSFGGWGGTGHFYNPTFNVDAPGGIDIIYYDIDLSQLIFGNTWELKGYAEPGVSASNSMPNLDPRANSIWGVFHNQEIPNGLDWNNTPISTLGPDGLPNTNDDTRHGTIQDWYKAITGGKVNGPGSDIAHNNESYVTPNPRYPAAPPVTASDLNKYDFRVRILPTGSGTYTYEMWSRMHSAASNYEGCAYCNCGVWNHAMNNCPDAWRAFTNGGNTVFSISGFDLSAVYVFMGLGNGNTASSQALTWGKIEITGTPTSIPSVVWVDDNYYAGGINDGHTWGYDAFATIQNGINGVAAGGSVNVAAGTYDESLDIQKPLSLLSAGASTTNIDRSANPAAGTVVTIHNLAGNVTLNGFTIKTGPASTVASNGIHISNLTGPGTITITNNIIWGVQSATGPAKDNFPLIAGYFAVTTPKLVFDHNIVHGGGSNPILIEKWMGPTEITNNTLDNGIKDDEASDVIFMMNYDGSHNTQKQLISGNTIDMGWGTTNQRGAGISIASSFNGGTGAGGFTDVEITNNNLINLKPNRRGISTWNNSSDGTGGDITNAIISGNTISNATGFTGEFGIRVLGKATGTQIINNNVSGATDAVKIQSYNGHEATGTHVNNNSLTNSTKGLNNLTTSTIDAELNWWGTAVETEIQAKISGLVDYDPWIGKVYNLVNTVYDFPSAGVKMEFTTLPLGGGTVTVTRYNEVPAGFPGSYNNVGMWLDITSSMPNYSFDVTVYVDVFGIVGFDATTIVMYKTPGGTWMAVPGGVYLASDPMFGGHPSFSFVTNHFTPFTFINTPATAYDVYLSSSTSAAAGFIYPNTDWGVTSYEPNDWDFASPITLYIVPEVGSVFGASDITIEWDNTMFSYVGVDPSGGIYDNPAYQFFYNQLGTTNSVTINASRTDNLNFNIGTNNYIAKLNLNLLKPGFGPISFSALDFRAFDGGGGQLGVFVAGNNGEVKSYLGDVASSSSTATGDGLVDFYDLTPWSISYWSGVGGFGMTNYKVKYDIGPTSTNNVYGIPAVDAKIQFEDLVIFSMSYGLSANNVYPKIEAEPTAPVELQLGEPVIAGSQTRIPLYVSGGVQNVRAMSLTFAGQFGKLVSVEKGSLLNEFTNPVMVMSNTDGNQVYVDLAVFGAEEVGINTEGEVLTLIFEGNTEININTAEVRNILNGPMAVNISGPEGLVPSEFALMQNYPNPFNPTTTINYALPAQAMVEISIYNALGERVAMLVNEIKEAGRHTVEFNASGYSSGIYFYQIKANDFVSVKKMILMK